MRAEANARWNLERYAMAEPAGDGREHASELNDGVNDGASVKRSEPSEEVPSRAPFEVDVELSDVAPMLGSREGDTRSRPPVHRRRRCCPDVDSGVLVALMIGSAGNVLEWLDFAIFGFMSTEIGALFFPGEGDSGGGAAAGSGDRGSTASELSALAVFAGAFVVRPLGGVLFGTLGDRRGRKAAVVASILMMGASSLALGCLPTHATAGDAASVALVVVRLLQGLSVGGQMVGSFVLMVELAPPRQRMVFAAICSASATLGSALGSAVSAVVRASMSHDQLMEWGWRLPFLAGVVVSMATLAVRHKVPESSVFLELQARRQREGLRSGTAPRQERLQPGLIIAVAGAAALWCGGTYIHNVFVATMASTILSPPLDSAYAINTGTMLVLIIIMVLWSLLLGGRYRSSTVMVASAMVLVVSSPLAFQVMSTATTASIVVGQLLIAVPLAAYAGPVGAWMCEACPPERRYSSVAIGYNVAQACFGGTAPMVCTALVAHFDTPVAAGVYLSFIAVASLLSVATARCCRIDPGELPEAKRGVHAEASEISR